eukprot:TRINITY_DN13597_c0_g1_i1.p1 TRINITY_DN13597_c0_g1~~TRINITY_DN13597_c0_g1_i1.p1  ORF type:complete len:109 (+),score=32.70 TRINITY_DN13597_c0_g1_i1:69-395(+)
MNEMLAEKEGEIVELKEVRKRIEKALEIEFNKVHAENKRVVEEFNEWVDKYEGLVKELEVVERKNERYKEKLVKREEFIQALQRTLREYEKEFDFSKTSRGRRGGARR